jgi:monoamine oxidase
VDENILIVGAGASGLMAARILSNSGKKVTIVEARSRIGGRIWPLSEKEFDYPAQGGAEFVHGLAPIIKKLIKESGMTLIKMKGNMWNSNDDNFTDSNSEFILDERIFHRKLKELKKDIPINDFLNRYFPAKKYKDMRNYIVRLAEGYDAGDSKRISTFALREEWLNGGSWLQYRIKEGYGGLLSHLKDRCIKQGVKINLNTRVQEIDATKSYVKVHCNSKKTYEAKKILITVPLPILKSIKFNPAITGKLDAVSELGFGAVIKILLKFKERWWINATDKELSKIDFIFSDEPVGTWWTQYPNPAPVLTGWIAGPKASKLSSNYSRYILDLSLTSLSNIFKIEKKLLKEQLTNSKIINWAKDPLALGAYSYPTVNSDKARIKILKPVNNRIFFAGEALYSGKDTATVEGALGSGLEAAKKILALE